MTDKVNKKHFFEIDVCRGIGIILVVLGHAIKQTGVQNTAFDMIVSVIYSFHMPLFFFLSGFVSDRIMRFISWEERKNYIKGRAFRLLIPYFSVGLLYMPLKFFLSRYAVKPYDFASAWKIFLGDNPNTALWFVYILFVVSVVCALILNEKNLNMLFGGSIILMAAAYGMDWTLRSPKYFFFFLLGIYVRRNYEKWKMLLSKTAVFFCAAAIFILANIILYNVGLSIMIPVTALSGITVCVFCAVKVCGKNGRLYSLLTLLGKYSMDIYILSEPFNTAAKIVFWSVLKINYLACTICCFAAALILPVPVSKYIVRKVKIFRVLLLGSR